MPRQDVSKTYVIVDGIAYFSLPYVQNLNKPRVYSEVLLQTARNKLNRYSVGAEDISTKDEHHSYDKDTWLDAYPDIVLP